MDRSKMGASSFPTDRHTYIQTAAEQKYLIMEWRSLTPGRAQRRASDERHTLLSRNKPLPPRKKNLPFFVGINAVAWEMKGRRGRKVRVRGLSPSIKKKRKRVKRAGQERMGTFPKSEKAGGRGIRQMYTVCNFGLREESVL